MRWRRWGGSRFRKELAVREGVEQPQQRWNRLLEGRVERQHLPGHLGADGAGVVAILQVAVSPEEIEHREIGRGLAVGNRRTFEH